MAKAPKPGQLLKIPSVATVRRPATPDGPEFELRYIRVGEPSACPVLIIPGGPGLGSVLPYWRLRNEAAARGLDVLMVEHRGVGLSRTTVDGGDLPPEAITVDQTVDDLAAVLDHAEVNRAVVYGSSYGSYLAQGLGVRHPDKVAGMVLDSPVLSADDDEVQRRELRRLYLDGAEPATKAAAALLRELMAKELVPVAETGSVIQLVHEFGGPPQVDSLLKLMATGHGSGVWRWLAELGDAEVTKSSRYLMEFDLVGRLAFRELGFAPEPDGQPLDVNLGLASIADQFPAFEREPYDLAAELPRFDWPISVLSGEHDIRTPRPIAERIVELAPDAVLTPIAGVGHSALDNHRRAALLVAGTVLAGSHRRLARLAPRLAELPRRGGSRLLGPMLEARFATATLAAQARDSLHSGLST